MHTAPLTQIYITYIYIIYIIYTGRIRSCLDRALKHHDILRVRKKCDNSRDLMNRGFHCGAMVPPELYQTLLY